MDPTVSDILFWIGFAALIAAAWLGLAENNPHAAYRCTAATCIAWTLSVVWAAIQPVLPP